MLDDLTRNVRQQLPVLQRVATFGQNFFHQGRVHH
jgi:hypothetical protein